MMKPLKAISRAIRISKVSQGPRHIGVRTHSILSQMTEIIKFLKNSLFNTNDVPVKSMNRCLLVLGENNTFVWLGHAYKKIVPSAHRSMTYHFRTPPRLLWDPRPTWDAVASLACDGTCCWYAARCFCFLQIHQQRPNEKKMFTNSLVAKNYGN
jgi:hypothetical protein